MSTKEFALMIDLMIAVSEKAGEGELIKLLKKYQQQSQAEAGENEAIH